MKKTFFTLITVMATTAMFAQCPTDKGQVQLNAGTGISTWGLPVYAGFDYGVNRNVAVGGELSFRSYVDFPYTHAIFGISGNADYHFGNFMELPVNIDYYAGINLGYFFWNSSAGYKGGNKSGIGAGAHFGGRYYVNKRLGAFLEFGAGSTFGLKLGASYRM